MNRLFDAAGIALAGNHLIEASAGTGKTHAITNLFLRLLLKKNEGPQGQGASYLGIRQIQVVTYTNAATAELRERIRRRIAAAGTFFAGDEPGGNDPFLIKLREQCARSGMEARHAAAIFGLALQDMDSAGVSTIHGFCQKILQSYAMDTGFPLDAEMSTDERGYYRVALDDFWQTHALSWPDVFHDQLAHSGIHPDSLFLKLVRELEKILVLGADSLILPQPPAGDWPAALAAAAASLALAWRDQGKEVAALLLSCNCLSRNKENGYTPERISAIQEALDRFALESGRPLPVAALKALTPSALSQALLKKNKETPPAHPFFGQAGQLLSLLEQAEKNVVTLAAGHCLEAVPRLKKKARVLGFGDQLTLLGRALSRPGTGAALAAQVRRDYPAALVDEFQDTDPVQYEIFSKIYPGDREHFFCAIGDPKQSIYAFRGADIFSYLNAAKKTPRDHCHTLLDNWRSEARLVAGVNALFGAGRRPFLFEDIVFSPASSPKAAAVERLRFSDDRSPLNLVAIEPLGNKEDSKTLLARIVADRIVALLVDGRSLRAFFAPADGQQARALVAGDIAVLVRTHSEGELLHRALGQRKIRAVLSSRINVFATDEARELDSLLAAILEPRWAQGLSRALVTPLLGQKARDLLLLTENEERFEAITADFEDLRTLWTRSGIVAMFSALCRKHDALERLAGLSEGERRITNYRHLTELIQEEAHDAGLDPHEQHAWLKRLRAEADNGQENHLLRLESDRDLVRILTVHASKGLQFPVVFCPLFPLASGQDKAAVAAVFHDDEGRFRIDLGGPDFPAHRERAREEKRAEDIRNFYVAVTRAKNHCVVLSVLPGKKDTKAVAAPFSVLAHLLGQGAEDGERAPVDLESALFDLAMKNPESISCCRAENPSSDCLGDDMSTRAITAKARSFSGTLRFNWRLESFSSLAAAAAPPPPAGGTFSFLSPTAAMDAETPERDRDDFSNRSQPDSGQVDFIHFPRGARAGNLLHSIMERIDFTNEDGMEKIIAGCLARHGYDLLWVSALKEGLRQVLRTPLVASPSFCLKDIPRQDRLNELEFYYPVPQIDHGRLASYFRSPADAVALEKPEKERSKTFLKGFIDLVFRRDNRFYLADYKSNFLGEEAATYGQEALAGEMTMRGYDMQQRIYTVALDRFLRRRLGDSYDYDRHFGGVFYLFLRGMTPQNGPATGVRFVRPERRSVAAMERLLDTTGAGTS